GPPRGTRRCATFAFRATALQRNKHQRHTEPTRARARKSYRTVCLRLLIIGLRHQRQGTVQRRRSDTPTNFTLRSHESCRRTSVSHLLASLRTALRLPAILHGLWTTPAPRSRNS